jgi:hypothetical protein
MIFELFAPVGHRKAASNNATKAYSVTFWLDCRSLISPFLKQSKSNNQSNEVPEETYMSGLRF